MNIDLVRLIATIVAFAAAASKLLSATVPFWGSFPPVVQRFLPGAVLVLGALPSALAGATTWTDFGVAVLGAIALALPGRHTNIPVQHPPETKVPPQGPTLVAVLLLALGLCSLQSCSSSPKPLEWPSRIAQCAPPPAQLLETVGNVLFADGVESLSQGSVSALEALAKEHGPATLACVVDELVDSWTMSRGLDPAEGHAAQRGRAFLESKGVTVEDSP